MIENARISPIVLASGSPRRRELLELAGVPFSVVVSDADDEVPQDLPPCEMACELALRKARAVAARIAGDPQLAGRTVLGADTIVVVDGEVFGKPADAGQAREMLAALSGRAHHVVTGVALVAPAREHAFSETTAVRFWPLDESDIADYIASGEPFDKAGAYGIQGKGSVLVEGIEGDYFNVVGLPVARTVRELAAFAGQDAAAPDLGGSR